jgi:hypothetical protein
MELQGEGRLVHVMCWHCRNIVGKNGITYHVNNSIPYLAAGCDKGLEDPVAAAAAAGC